LRNLHGDGKPFFFTQELDLGRVRGKIDRSCYSSSSNPKGQRGLNPFFAKNVRLFGRQEGGSTPAGGGFVKKKRIFGRREDQHKKRGENCRIGIVGKTLN